MPEALVALGEGKRFVGRLRFESDARRQHSQFEYDEAWLAAEDRFALAPGLPLREGSHFSSGNDDKRSALPGPAAASGLTALPSAAEITAASSLRQPPPNCSGSQNTGVFAGTSYIDCSFMAV